MNVGDYVRFKSGVISKIEEHKIILDELFSEIVKSSPNIIDYVNGEKVIALRKDISERDIHMNSKDNLIFTDYDITNNWYFGIDTDKIKSIVTKERFESIEYKVGD